MQNASLTGKNIRENEKEMETVRIETLLRKSAITGNKKWEIVIVKGEVWMGDVTACLDTYRNDLRVKCVAQHRKGRTA